VSLPVNMVVIAVAASDVGWMAQELNWARGQVGGRELDWHADEGQTRQYVFDPNEISQRRLFALY
jgi:hypothetical protein